MRFYVHVYGRMFMFVLSYNVPVPHIRTLSCRAALSIYGKLLFSLIPVEEKRLCITFSASEVIRHTCAIQIRLLLLLLLFYAFSIPSPFL